MVVLRPGFGLNDFKMLAHALLHHLMKEQHPMLQSLECEAQKRCFLCAASKGKCGKNVQQGLWIALAEKSAMQWLLSNFLIQLVPEKRFDLELEVF